MALANTPHSQILMGILNLTPDSFSDGGQHNDTPAAVAFGLQLARDGADIIDVGGESTRPGSQRVSAAEQVRRVVPTIQKLRETLDRQGYPKVIISIDTTLSEVAAAALSAGAAMLNDVSAGREDPGMFHLAAAHRVPLILMHMLGEPGTMQDQPHYEQVVEEVLDFLLQRVELGTRAGIPRQDLWLDPGIGFGKTLEHNLALLRAMDRFVATGQRVLLGTSRKRFIAGCCDGFSSPDVKDRLPGTLAANLVAAQKGVQAFRVHDVAAHRQALAVLGAIELNTSRTKNTNSSVR